MLPQNSVRTMCEHGDVEKEIEKEKEIEIDNMLKKAFKRIPK
jgi:hypothetical protein